MPGPILSMTSVISDSFDTFNSCEDVQEAWGCNGSSTEVTTPFKRNCTNGLKYTFDYSKVSTYINGMTDKAMEEEATVAGTEIMEEEQEDQATKGDVIVAKVTPERQITYLEECPENAEMDTDTNEQTEQTEVSECLNIPVVEARLKVDIGAALTRQKIASVQWGKTLSYADKEDVEEPPTRRSHPISHNRDSMEIGGLPLHKPASSVGSSPCLPPKIAKNTKVSRNPSYHSAVRSSSTSSAGADSPAVVINSLNVSAQNWSSSSEGGSPGHEPLYASVDNVGGGEMVSESSIKSELPKLEKNQPLDLPVAANMPRSASFSGGGILSPLPPANGSLGEAYARRGSISQPSTPVTKRSQPSLTIPKEATSTNTSSTNTPTRGSAISRSFRRLFSTPVKTVSYPSNHPTSASAGQEDYWLDIPDYDSPSSSESRPTSRLRKLSTTLTRKLSVRSTKMSNSHTFPSGTNGHHQQGLNGEALPDSSNLVDYEELMKLFTCSGCQSIMAPPLHQCRKGHLVCNTCRFSLKQVCPVCKQRFAETTNLMMEQVCHLVKFPCRWSNSGCPEFHSPKSRLDHEHFCAYRPLHCHHATKGCAKILILKDMQQHVDECEFKDK